MIAIELVHPLQEKAIQSWKFDLARQSISIGRSRQNDIILMSAVVSRHHANLYRDANGWHLEPLGHNGCFIDEKPVTQAHLRNGQTFRLARTGPRLRVVLGSEAAETPPSPQQQSQSEQPLEENALSARETFVGR